MNATPRRSHPRAPLVEIAVAAADQGMKLKPKDHAEDVALFRVQLLGPVLHAELSRGELMSELRALAQKRFVPPGTDTSRTYSVPTLLRWRRVYLKRGLAGLRPASRRLGDALGLSDKQRELLLEIRRQHPAVPANVILETLEGPVGKRKAVSVDRPGSRSGHERAQSGRHPVERCAGRGLGGWKCG